MKLNVWEAIPTGRTKKACSLYYAGMLAPWLLVTYCVSAPASQTVLLAQFKFDSIQPLESTQPNQCTFSAEGGNDTGGGSILHTAGCNYQIRVGNGCEYSLCTSNWTVGDCWQFTCSPQGVTSIYVSFDLVASSNGPADFQLEYSTNNGSTFNVPTDSSGKPDPKWQFAALENGELDGNKPFWSSVCYHNKTHYKTSPIAVPDNAQNILFELVNTSTVSTSRGTVVPNGTARVGDFEIFGTWPVETRSTKVTIPKPPPTKYGWRVDRRQLDAKTSVPGTIEYIPSDGTTLDAGTNTVTAIFTPFDTNYDSATDTVTLVVDPAPLTVSAFNAARMVGTTNDIFDGTIYGLKNGDNITASYSCSATSGSDAGDYDIVPTLNDPDGRLANYIVSTNYGTLTVSTDAVAEVILARWDFSNTNIPSATLAGGEWYTNIVAQEGNGTASVWHKHPSDYRSLSSDGTNDAFASSNWVPGDFWQFKASSEFASHLSVVWHQSSSGAGPRTFLAAATRKHFNGDIHILSINGGGDAEEYRTYDLSGTNGVPNCSTNSTSGTNGVPDLLIESSVPLLLNLSRMSEANGPTNLFISFVDSSPLGAGGDRAGPIGENSIMDLTIYGVVHVPTFRRIIPWPPLRPITVGTNNVSMIRPP